MKYINTTITQQRLHHSIVEQGGVHQCTSAASTCWRDDQDWHVTVNGNRYRSMIAEFFFGPNWMLWTWRMCGSNRTMSQGTHRMTQSIYWKPGLDHVLSQEIVQSIGCFSRAKWSRSLFFCGFMSRLWPMPTFQWRLMNFERILIGNCSNIGRFMLENRRKLRSASGLSASVPVVAKQKKSSSIHNTIQRT